MIAAHKSMATKDARRKSKVQKNYAKF